MNDNTPLRDRLLQADIALGAAARELSPEQCEEIARAREIIEGIFCEVAGIDPWLQTR